MPSERDYAERLREQAYKTLSPQISDLERELKEFSNSLSSGLYQIERKLEAVSQVELPTMKIVLDEILQDVLRQKDLEEESLVLFTRDLQSRETQEEILGLLLDYANGFFPRVALFTVRNDRFVGWSSRGYSEETARDIADLSLPCSECSQFQEVLESKSITTTLDLSADSTLGFLQSDPGSKSHLVPLVVMQRTVAILFAEGSDDTVSKSNSLTVLTDLTDLRLENIALKILFALTEGKTEAKAEFAAEAGPVEMAAEFESPVEAGPVEETAESEPLAEAESVEEAEESEPPAEVESLEEAAESEPLEEIWPVEETAEPELLAEAEPVEEAAEPELLAEAEPVEEAAEPELLAEAEPVEEAAESEPQEPEESKETEEDQQQETAPESDEEKLHSDAKRFARLLISEIKLYNENAVSEGRENRDLYLRLKRDIDKCREMYEDRVSPVVSQKIDYLHEEIVRILGKNDSSLLGSDYPGPRVEI